MKTNPIIKAVSTECQYLNFSIKNVQNLAYNTPNSRLNSVKACGCRAFQITNKYRISKTENPTN